MRIKYFNRYELKYLLHSDQCEPLLEELAAYVEPDRQGDGQGRYAITSLYYDTVDYKAYWDKIEGHRFRRKVRIRVYGEQAVTPDTNCFVEIKQRNNKTLQKKRVLLPYSSAVALCEAGEEVSTGSETDRAIIDEVRYLYYAFQLQPACIVSYHRLAFEGSDYDPGLRITFDTNLKGRTHELTLLAQGYAQSRFFLPPHWCIMEVKVNYRVPFWLTQLIAKHRCPLRRISKYCVALEQSKALLRTQRFVF